MMSETVGDLRRRKTNEVPSSTRTSDGSLESKERPTQQLLPGIPDEITLALVVPKLSWRTFYVLSPVSRGWKRAIQSGQAYDARNRAEGTETLAVIDRIITGGTYALGLYSGNDKSVHKLPPIPNVRIGIPRLSKCISLDGKIYVIGGQRDLDEPPVSSDGELPYEMDHRALLHNVYVLDLARQRPWKHCESMGYARVYFGIGVVGGKIYVMGGQSYSTRPAVTVSEVYDPVYNTWHPFESMLNWRIDHQVLTFGEELFIYGGCFSLHYEVTKLGFVPTEDDTDYYLESANFLEIYQPGKNGRRKVTPFDSGVNLFIHRGQLHTICWWAIDVYDMNKKSWTSRYAYSHAGSSSALLADDMLVVLKSCNLDIEDEQELRHVVKVDSSVLVSGNELVARVCWLGDRGEMGHDLLCSIGFGKQETIEWQKVECSFEVSSLAKMCSLQL